MRYVLINDAGVDIITSIFDLTLLNSKMDVSVFNKLNTLMSLEYLSILLNWTYTWAVNSLFGTRITAVGLVVSLDLWVSMIFCMIVRI